IGLPSAFNYLSEVSFYITITLLVGTMGVVALSAHQIVYSLTALVVGTLGIGMGSASSIFLGQDRGRNSYHLLGIHTHIAYTILILLIGCLSILFYIFPTFFIEIYSQDPQTIKLAVSILMIGIFFQFFDAANALGVVLLRGMEITRRPFLHTIIAFWGIGFALSYILGIFQHRGPAGIWTGMTVAAIIGSVLQYVHLQYTLRTLQAIKS
ncbi:MAG: hypothetical protein KDK51_08925, partial [Deltaproteobacteria bacterium]|nr:hypothetical protein [Deltaproteobacteria bacterium]